MAHTEALEMLALVVLSLILVPCTWGADTAGESAGVALADDFAAGSGRWRPQGAGLQVAIVEETGNPVLRLDNTAGAAQAFLGTTAGEPGQLMRFTISARTADGQAGKVGLHRYAGSIHWATIGGAWTPVQWEAKAHAQETGWYIVIPAGQVVLVDNVRLERVVLTEQQRRQRLADLRRESEAAALTAYRALGPTARAPATAVTVGGQFPVALYTVRPTADRAATLAQIFSELAAAGINLVHNSDFEDWPEHTPNYAKINSTATARTYLDLAHRHGLQVLMGFDRTMVVKHNADGLRARTQALTEHPGLWGWYLIDEPDLNGATPQAMRAAYETVHGASGRPITACLCTRATFAEYAPATDIIITDVDPVSTGSLFALVPHLEHALQVTHGRQPVWAAIQVHNNDLHGIRWGGLEGIVTAPRRPTPEEVRCMTYLAIAHGACGIIFYAYDAWVYGQLCQDGGLYQGVQELARELRGYSPWLTADVLTRATVPAAEDRLVSVIVRGKRGGQALVVAVNAFDAPSGPVAIPAGGEPLNVSLAPHEVLIRKVQWPAR